MLPSPSLGMDRRMLIYTPPGYHQTTKNFPVLYLLHGGGGDEEAWNRQGRAPEIIDSLIATGKAYPMIVVLTNGNPGRAATLNEIHGDTVNSVQAKPSNMRSGELKKVW